MERGSGDSFLVEVAKRDAATLLPIIAQHVRPGTVAFTAKGGHTLGNISVRNTLRAEMLPSVWPYVACCVQHAT